MNLKEETVNTNKKEIEKKNDSAKDNELKEMMDKKKETSADDVNGDAENAKDEIKKEGQKEEQKKEQKEGKGDDSVMNMLLSYLQKNKDDPKVLQTMLNVMNGQGKNNLPTSAPNLGAYIKKEQQEEKEGGGGNEENKLSCDGSATSEKKDNIQVTKENKGMGEEKEKSKKSEGERGGSKLYYIFSRKKDKDDEKKNKTKNEKIKSNDVHVSVGENITANSTKENQSNITSNIGEDEKDKNSSKFGFGYFSSNKLSENASSSVTALDSKANDTNLESIENNRAVKKKHSELVEDNDDYEIENVEEKEPMEEEAISLIENMNIINNDKKKSDPLGIGSLNNISSSSNNNSNNYSNNNNNSNNYSNNNNNSNNYSNNYNSNNNNSSIYNSNNNSGGDNNDSGDFKLYHSKNTWEELKIDNELIQILTYLKFFGPSKIQAYALPIILNSNKNLIAQSQNGSGKTLTFVIAMLSKINRTLSCLQAVCICPTRELSQQNYDVVGNFTKYLNVKVFLAVPLCERYNKASGFQIYVGTPGKTLDFLKRKYIDTTNIKIFVLDEADDLIDIKNNMSSQVESIKRFLPKHTQILLFSATYNKDVRLFADQFAPRATKISVRQEDLTLKCVKQYYLITENDEQKYYYLSELYCSMTISQCVIFVNSKKAAYNLYQFMTDNNHNVTLICADSIISRFTKNQVQKANVLGMDPKTRDTLMSDFKKGISKVLICTDLLSRGIDVPSISLVINFDLPYIYQGRIEENSNPLSNQRVNMETYIHRIGRTGRFGTKGMAINFISKNQMTHIRQIEQFYKCIISDLEFDSELMITSLTKIKT
ncbi:ATP-dependent RNA helicase DBP5 [Plasmodium brasilianum]|uniref:RNA helicase n=2 Tax=Plasmodium (Plasmodium) TaxID=418103 RepID=A0A1D3SQ04_PLAMA|nr:ATP-dependent RNA helicase DBP5, putative [Plasmodium malariae]KAI4836697.1 ATP-dependent RNA helicase DBP5 [Plasmodium brasilianum]SCO93982.1 ATP-dependent RNA helicase DBP5, putative [Plasmodium malariae]